MRYSNSLCFLIFATEIPFLKGQIICGKIKLKHWQTKILVFNVWWFLPQCWMGGTTTATYASPLGFAKLNRHRSSARYNCTFLYFCVYSLCTFSVCFPSFFVKLILLGTKKKPYILRVWHYMSRKNYNKYQMLRVITIHCKTNCSI